MPIATSCACTFCGTALPSTTSVHDVEECRNVLVERGRHQHVLEGLSVQEITTLIEALNRKIASLHARLADAEREASVPREPVPVLDRCPSCGMSATHQLELVRRLRA